jgi:hypothetical protein
LHYVYFYENGEYKCDCDGFARAKKMGRDCRHIKIFKNYLLKNAYRPKEYTRAKSEDFRENPYPEAVGTWRRISAVAKNRDSQTGNRG